MGLVAGGETLQNPHTRSEALKMSSSSAASSFTHPHETKTCALQFRFEHPALVRGMSAVMSHPTFAAEVGPAVVKQRIQLPCGQCLGGAAPLHSIIMAHWADLAPARMCGSGPAAPAMGGSPPAMGGSGPAAMGGSGPAATPAGGDGSSSGPAVPSSSSAGPAVPSAEVIILE